ncbi:MAG: sugar ABC transporter permease [Caldilineaceae bacterium]
MSNALAHGQTPPASAPRMGADSAARRAAGRMSPRRLREALLAYFFLLPAFLIVGTFGLFPLLFAAYQSTLRGINKVVGTYDGLGNYVKAIAGLTYVLGFWGALLLVLLAVRAVVHARRDASGGGAAAPGRPLWPWAAPGIAYGTALSLLGAWIIRLLPLLLAIPEQMRGKRNTPENFRRLLGDALTSPTVWPLLAAAVAALVVGILLSLAVHRYVRRKTGLAAPGDYTGAFVQATLELAFAALLAWLTWTQLQADVAAADAAGGLAIWSQLVLISAGIALLLLAWWIWDRAGGRSSTLGTFARLAAAAALLAGAWLLIGELPRAIGAGDPVWWNGLLVTFFYAVGTIPAQLVIALVLAVLLFQDIRGRTFFRVAFFLPYIAPFVGTAAVFKLIFSSRPGAPVNAILGFFGLGPLLWLNSPQGIFSLVAPSLGLPPLASGPSLALVVIMIFGIWTFFGFNTVIFLAGLGNIPREMYEAAAIDGGGRWAQFRHITLPLLSPTIYFLTLYSVIGTFKAFNHIYVLRTGAALGTTDTASVVIFQTFKRDTRYGYASALAILLLLVIIALTAANNRLANKRVFYG